MPRQTFSGVLKIEAINFQLLAGMAEACRAAGVNLNQVLQAVGLEIDMTVDPAKRLPLSVFDALYAEVAALGPKVPFPLVFGAAFKFEGLPELATFVNSSHTLRENLKVFEWTPRLIHPALNFEIRDEPDRPMLVVKVRDPDGERHDLPGFVESTVAAVFHIASALLPQHHVVRRIDFKHQPLSPVEQYESHFSVPVHFGQKENAIFFQAEMLDAELPGAVPVAHRQAEALILKRLHSVSVPQSTADHLAELFKGRLSLLTWSLPQIADQLHLHPRTLQRKLALEKTSFAQVLADVRDELACEMLGQTVLDIETIAEKLGYSDRRSFTLAFHKRRGVSPRQYRQSLVQAES